MEGNKIKLAIGFIVYGKSTIKYLPYFLPSLVRTADSHMITHDFTDKIKILCFDNGEKEGSESVKYIWENYPQIVIMRFGRNLGFAKAYNVMMRRAKEMDTKYFLALNPDMILKEGAIAKMVQALDEDNKLGSVCPKILCWDFENNSGGDGPGIKTDIIDSCGISQLSALNFFDIGQSEKDTGQCEGRKIIGPSGAAAMYRMSALEAIKEEENYFDELMFMYEEDCDLAYRLKIVGFKSKCVSDAIIYHDRTAVAKGQGNLKIALNRRNKPRKIKRWGFLHKHIIFIKYWSLQSAKEKFEIIWYAFKMFIFAILFEQYLLKEYFNLIIIFKRIKKYK